MKNLLYTTLLIFFVFNCNNQTKTMEETSEETDGQTEKQTIGTIERLDSGIDALISEDAVIEVLGEGFTWSEGPVWLSDKEWLLFSDVPENRVYRWREESGVEVYLEPSGFTGEETDSREPGSNGLTLDAAGNLILCQHGDRRIARFTGDFEDPKPQFETIIDRYEGKRFNSPNDLVYDAAGNLYFTDPPYGLNKDMMNDPKKELPFQGVYRLSAEGDLALITKEMSRPNGIGLSPDGQTLYVANSDPEKAIWMTFQLNENGAVESENLFYDATEWVGKEPGLPDGLKVDRQGNIWATGPGGVWVFNAEGTVLGKIKPGDWGSANCGFDEEEETLFITSDNYLVRVVL